MTLVAVFVTCGTVLCVIAYLQITYKEARRTPEAKFARYLAVSLDDYARARENSQMRAYFDLDDSGRPYVLVCNAPEPSEWKVIEEDARKYASRSSPRFPVRILIYDGCPQGNHAERSRHLPVHVIEFD